MGKCSCRQWVRVIDVGQKWGSTDERATRTMGCLVDGRTRFGERFLVPYFGNTKVARSVDRPVGTITTKDRYAVVDGSRMRMMSVAEYRTAMSFPRDYVLTGTATEQKAMLGNAVPPELARRVIEQVREAA